MRPAVLVIESPGKYGAIRSALDEVGLSNVALVYTRGRLFNLPDSRLGVSTDGRWSPEWIEMDAQTLAVVDRAIASAKEVWIATDLDDEGELIAAQVGERTEGNLRRLGIRTFDHDALVQLLADKEDIGVNVESVRRATVRRVVDRLVGALSAPNTVGLGRVKTALMASVEDVPVTIEERLCNAGAGWLSRSLGGYADATVPLEAQEVRFDTFATMIDLSRDLQTSPQKLWREMQRAYESGEVSYPRSDESSLGRPALLDLAAQAQKAGLDGAPIEAVEAVEPERHGGIRVLSHELKGRLMRRLFARLYWGNRSDWRVVRETRRSGPTTIFREVATLNADPPQTISGPLAPQVAKANDREAAVNGIERALVERCSARGIGRPSTVDTHAATVAKTALNRHGRLHRKAQRSVEHARDIAPGIVNGTSRDVHRWLSGEARLPHAEHRANVSACLDAFGISKATQQRVFHDAREPNIGQRRKKQP